MLAALEDVGTALPTVSPRSEAPLAIAPADRPASSGAKAAKREPSWVDGIAETHHSEGARGFTLKQKRAAAHAKPYRKKLGVGKVDVAIGAKRSAAKAHRTQKPRR